jgi:hypothetical protein
MNTFNTITDFNAKSAKKTQTQRENQKTFAVLCGNSADSAVKISSGKNAKSAKKTQSSPRENQKTFAVLCVNLCDLCG